MNDTVYALVGAAMYVGGYFMGWASGRKPARGVSRQQLRDALALKRDAARGTAERIELTVAASTEQQLGDRLAETLEAMRREGVYRDHP